MLIFVVIPPLLKAAGNEITHLNPAQPSCDPNRRSFQPSAVLNSTNQEPLALGTLASLIFCQNNHSLVIIDSGKNFKYVDCILKPS
jgi:hypothetical protein